MGNTLCIAQSIDLYRKTQFNNNNNNNNNNNEYKTIKISGSVGKNKKPINNYKLVNFN